MRFKNLQLVVTIVLLASCDLSKSEPRFCPISVHANDDVKKWFQAKEPLPQCVKDYLKNIGNQQADIDKYCH